MAIILKKDKTLIYRSRAGILNKTEIKKADDLSKELDRSLSDLEKKFLKQDLLTKEGQKLDSLKIWYQVGRLLRRIVKKYRIDKSGDEEFFWRSIYDHIPKTIQKKDIPKRSLRWKRNHFRLCALMAKFDWEIVQTIGTWALWREIFDNKTILNDDRTFNWVINKVELFRKYNLSREKIRPFLYAVSKRLNKIDTSVLSDKELINKLNDIHYKIDFKNGSLLIL